MTTTDKLNDSQKNRLKDILLDKLSTLHKKTSEKL
ncbi:Uncharacterised protein [Cytobacillus firmus]|nr:Uncharacterised protein [Cytobacillus firmus]